MSAPAILIGLLVCVTILGVAGKQLSAATTAIANALGSALKLRSRHDAADEQADRERPLTSEAPGDCFPPEIINRRKD